MHRTPTPNLMRSSDGGANWEASNVTLFRTPSRGAHFLDIGPAHQGPLILGQGADREEGWAMYFVAFGIDSSYERATGCGGFRSLFQLARVHTDSDGWLIANRSEGPSSDLRLREPPGVTPPAQPVQTTWHIAEAEAVVIACAEIERWEPGWYSGLPQGSKTEPTCCCASCVLPAECGGAGGAGVTRACPSMMWRNPHVARTFFEAVVAAGVGPSLRWQLTFQATSNATGASLRFSAVVAANGTIVSLTNVSQAGKRKVLVPLRQFRYDGIV